MTKDYKINENHVVLNPETIRSENSGANLEVKVAHLDDGWVYGYSYWYGNGGAASPCMAIKERQRYPDKNKAIIECLKCIRQLKIPEELKRASYVIEANCRQMTLF